MLSSDSIWLPYLYQYGLGAVIFVIGLVLALRSGATRLTRPEDRLWVAVLIGGFVWYAGIHLAWYLAAIYIMPADA